MKESHMGPQLLADHRASPQTRALTARLTQTDLSQVTITPKYHLTSWDFMRTDIIAKWIRTGSSKRERQRIFFIIAVVRVAVEQFDRLNYHFSHPLLLSQVDWMHLKTLPLDGHTQLPQPKV